MSNRQPSVATLGICAINREIFPIGLEACPGFEIRVSSAPSRMKIASWSIESLSRIFQIFGPMSHKGVTAHIGAQSDSELTANSEGVAVCTVARAVNAPIVDGPVVKKYIRGMTIIEIVIVLAILGILASIGIPLYNDYRFHTMVAQAKSDITDMDYLIAQYQADNLGDLPDSLGDIGKAGLVDPWGNPYGYLNLVTLKGNGHARKDKNLVPINSDYDLYSSGKDGESVGPLTAKASRDDVIRASNGRFVGLASDY